MFVICLEYEYAQVTVDLFCENFTLVHCSVVICNSVSPFFISQRACSNFEIWIHGVVRLDKRDKVYKAQAHCLMYALNGLHENVPPSMVTILSDGPLEVKMKSSMENSCLSIPRAAGLLDKVYNPLKLRHQNFLINYVGVSVYCHLKVC